MDAGDWGAMVRDGSIAACYAFAEDLPIEAAIDAALTEVGATEYGIDEFTLALTLVMGGAPVYCPDYAYDFQSEGGADAFTEAWTIASGSETIEAEGSFGDGTWIVGDDIEPGTYRTSGGDGCYWERLSGFGGTSDDRIANGYPDEDPAIVTIKASDAGFRSEDCGRWTLED